ncbi:TolC family protein [Viscerimonas tarda]
MKYLFLLLALLPYFVFAQKFSLSLEKAINIAQNKSSVKELIRYDSLYKSYDEYLFKTRILPQVSLSSNSSISHGITTITLPDGSDRFVNRYVSNYGMNMSISQLLPFTGGTLSATSSLNGLYNFSPEKLHSFNLNLFNFSYSQQLSKYNEYSWLKELQKRQKQINDIQYYQDIENLNQTVVNAYFELYVQQTYLHLNEKLLDLSKQFLDRNKKLYFEGKILEEEFIDSEIQYKRMLNDSQDSTAYNMNDKTFRNLLNIPDDYIIELESFEEKILNTAFVFDKNQILELSLKYNQKMQFEYEELEFKKNMQKNKASTGITWSLSLGGGITSLDFIEDPRRQFNVSVSASVPILDWGTQKVKREQMDIQHKITLLSNEEKEKKFRLEIGQDLDYISVLQKEIINEKDMIELQYKKLNILKKKIEMGQLNSIELSKAQTDIIKATISYNIKIKNLIMIVYKYRYMALWDIMTNNPIN